MIAMATTMTALALLSSDNGGDNPCDGVGGGNGNDIGGDNINDIDGDRQQQGGRTVKTEETMISMTTTITALASLSSDNRGDDPCNGVGGGDGNDINGDDVNCCQRQRPSHGGNVDERGMTDGNCNNDNDGNHGVGATTDGWGNGPTMGKEVGIGIETMGGNDEHGKGINGDDGIDGNLRAEDNKKKCVSVDAYNVESIFLIILLCPNIWQKATRLLRRGQKQK